MEEDRLGKFIVGDSFTFKIYMKLLDWMTSHRPTAILLRGSIVAFIAIAIYDLVAWFMMPRIPNQPGYLTVGQMIESFNFVVIPGLLFIGALTTIVYIEAILRFALIIFLATLGWVFNLNERKDDA